jgi:hypothetical protein
MIGLCSYDRLLAGRTKKIRETSVGFSIVEAFLKEMVKRR